MINQTHKPRKLIGTRNGLKIYHTLKAKKPINKIRPEMRKQKLSEKELRQILLERCKGLCENCHNPPDFRGLSKHEIRFRSRGGNPLDPENCLMLCGKCHNDKHHIKEH